MSATNFRRGVEAIRAAGGLMGVHEQVEAAGLRILRQSGPWLFHQCPNHDEHRNGDRNPSAQSNVETGYWQCFGCEARGRWPGSGGPVGGHAQTQPPDAPEIAPIWAGEDGSEYEPSPSERDVFEFVDEDGEALFRRHREDEKRWDEEEGWLVAGKRFWVEHRTNNGRWVIGAPPQQHKVPYRYPELLAAGEGEPVYLTEGEKDADSLAVAGCVATTGWNGTWDGWDSLLEGRDVKIVSDRDRAGLRKALRARDRLEGIAASVEVLLPAVGKDVSDHLHNGRRLDELEPYDAVVAEQAQARSPGRVPEPEPEAERGFPRPVLRSDADVAYEPVGWLWDGWVPLGNLTLFAGPGGVGKTHFALGMAARLSRGDMPGDFAGSPRKTIYLSTEDDFARVLKPRFLAAGGAEGHLLSLAIDWGDYETSPVFPENLPELRRAIRETGAALVALDPAPSHFAVRDSYNNQQMRHHVLGPLATLLMQERVAALALTHLTKIVPGKTFLDHILGSVAERNQARSVIGMGTHPDGSGRSVVAWAKGNYAADQGSFVVELREEAPIRIDGRMVAATGLHKAEEECDLRADDLIPRPAAREKKTDRVAAALETALERGPLPSDDLKRRLEANLEEPLSEGTFAAAKRALGVVAWQEDGRWVTGYEDHRP